MSAFINTLDKSGNEQPVPHAYIQYKGTDLCMDFFCDCGEECHFDGCFAYVVGCPNCGQEWEMPAIVFPRKRCDETYEGHTAQMMEADDD